MRLMAVGAHPDDVEIGCGGLLAMEGIAKHILHLSNGETSKYADGETRQGFWGPMFVFSRFQVARSLPTIEVVFGLLR